MTTAIEIRRESPLTVKELLDQKKIIQEAMAAAMKDKEHYGTIPGCGDKPTLLQPGAEMLLLLFRMNPDYVIERRDMERGHLEYNVTCRLTDYGGTFIGAGVGSACTMESKWRYRTGPKTLTDKPVPREYWDIRGSDPKRAQELLGGKGFSTQKNEAGAWMIAEGGGAKVENENPADVYNTCLKIAKKRALVDAVRTRTAASDIFAQDLEDLKANEEAANGPVIEAHTEKVAPKPAQPPRPANPEPPASGRTESGNTVVECNFESFKEQSGTSARGPWTAWFCIFDCGGQKLEAGTFDKKIHDTMDVLVGGSVRLEYKPAKKAGKFEIVSIEPPDEIIP